MQKNEVLEGAFVHMVFFWLKEPKSEAARSQFIKAVKKYVNKIPEITRQHIGYPADTDREVIDSSYTYSLIVTFNSKEDHDIYQEHPLHKEFIATAEELWKKVRVYDSYKI